MITAGIVGTGIFARQAHVPAIQGLPDQLKITACTNRTKSKAQTFAKDVGIDGRRVYDSVDELIASDVDVVDALVPVSSNLSIVQKCLDAGKPIAFEKPIAHNLKDAREIVRLTDASSQPVIVLENMCYYQAIPVLRQHLSKIGRVLNFVYYSENPFNPDSPYLTTPWRQKPDHEGGFISDGGVHQVALLTEVLGDVASVAGLMTQGREISGGPDAVNAIFKMKSGAQGTFIFSLSGCPPARHEFAIFGDQGSLVFDWGDRNAKKVTLYHDGKEEVFGLDPDRNDGVWDEFKNFADAVQRKDKSRIVATPRKAFHHFAVIVACVRSNEKNGAGVTVETC